MTLTTKDLADIGLHLGEATRRFVADKIKGVRDSQDERIAGLSARLYALENLVAVKSAPRLIYKQVWSADAAYVEGDAVTHQGSLWIALADNKSVRPGGDGGPWKLAVKRGRTPSDE